MPTQERYYHHKMAKAILDLYKSLPSAIQEEVRKLIVLTEKPPRDRVQAKKEKEKQFYQFHFIRFFWGKGINKIANT